MNHFSLQPTALALLLAGALATPTSAQEPSFYAEAGFGIGDFSCPLICVSELGTSVGPGAAVGLEFDRVALGLNGGFMRASLDETDVDVDFWGAVVELQPVEALPIWLILEAGRGRFTLEGEGEGEFIDSGWGGRFGGGVGVRLPLSESFDAGVTASLSRTQLDRGFDLDQRRLGLSLRWRR